MDSSTFLNHLDTKSKTQYKVLQVLFSFALSLFIIFSAVKFTLAFKPLYYFDIEYLNIAEQSNYSKDEIIKNYDYVINYLSSTKEQDFQLPSIPYSKFGQIHFKDVKRIFNSIDILLVITGLISITGLIVNLKRKSYSFLNLTPCILILLPAVLLTAFAVDFNAAFVTFHKIFFRNDYWQFDPGVDAIINILPEEFFLHSALLIVFLIISAIAALLLTYKKLSKKGSTKINIQVSP